MYNSFATLDRDLIDALCAEAKYMIHNGFVVLKIDTQDVPDELLGEVLKVKDYAFPTWAEEPFIEVEGLGYVPMSNLQAV